MSDRKRAIETLKQLRLDYEEFYEEHNNEVTQAYDMAISSLETDEAYQLEYESTTKNDVPDINVGKIDYVSRKEVIEQCQEWRNHEFVTMTNPYYYLEKRLNNLISVTPLSSGLEKNSKKLENITTTKDNLGVDAISRQAVLNTLDNMDSALDKDRTVETYKELLKECYKVLPLVTPQEPRKGHWIDREVYDADRWKCSECGRTEQYKENYCPNCGSDNREVEE